MTATEKLRRLLDERGVEWEAPDWEPDKVTLFVNDGIGWRFCEGIDWHDGVPPFCWVDTTSHLTPEQAVEATLGRGTCRAEEQYLDSYSDLTVTVCSVCGVPTDDLEDCNYCPNCGRKVVEP